MTEIKKLSPEDKEELENLIGIIEENLDKPEFWLPINKTAREHFFDDEWTEFYGIYDKDTLIAAAGIFYNEHEFGESLKQLASPPQSLAELGRAMVHPLYRGNNLLYRINSRLVERAREKGIENLLATIHPENLPSRKSFIKLGMKKECTYKKDCGYIRDIFLMHI